MTYHHDFMVYHYGSTVCFHLEEREIPASLRLLWDQDYLSLV